MCEKKQKIYIVGIGPGTESMMTLEAKAVIEKSDCFLGAKRMGEVLLKECEKPFTALYKPEEIKAYIETHEESQMISILVSGDVGFYSAAKKIRATLKEYQVEMVPGISTLIYFAAKLQISWEDFAFVSIHGRKQNLISAVKHNEKMAVLLDSKENAWEEFKKLSYYHMGEVLVYIGSRLSYKEEIIKVKKAEELTAEDFDNLSVAVIENPFYEREAVRHIKDEEFIRAKIPMTKEEVRTVCITKLELKKEGILYDVGAGTGSVGIEAALRSAHLQVFAVEKRTEAIALLEQNKQKFAADNLTIIEGEAPEVLKELPAPDCVFIGGSAGKLKSIVQAVKGKNAQVRIVITAISLETLSEVMAFEKEGLCKEVEVVQIATARAEKAGKSHLMKAENPIYIMTCM